MIPAGFDYHFMYPDELLQHFEKKMSVSSLVPNSYESQDEGGLEQECPKDEEEVTSKVPVAVQEVEVMRYVFLDSWVW
jgi:hypothetical protein